MSKTTFGYATGLLSDILSIFTKIFGLQRSAIPRQPELEWIHRSHLVWQPSREAWERTANASTENCHQVCRLASTGELYMNCFCTRDALFMNGRKNPTCVLWLRDRYAFWEYNLTCLASCLLVRLVASARHCNVQTETLNYDNRKKPKKKQKITYGIASLGEYACRSPGRNMTWKYLYVPKLSRGRMTEWQ